MYTYEVIAEVWLKGEYRIEVLNLIPKQTENRLGMLEVLLVYAHSVTFIC